MLKKIYIFIGLIILSQITFAQTNSIHNFYTQNLFYYSPAHTGDKEQLAAFVDLKQSMRDFKEVTESYSLGIHSPITEKMSIGGLIKKETLGVLETSSIRLDYSFKTKISDKHKLAFGINAGVLSRSIDMDMVVAQDLSDPTLINDNLDNKFFAGAAVSYNFKNFEFDLGIPVLYKTDDIYDDIYTSYWSFASYKINTKSEIWNFTPSVSASYNTADLLDYNANLLIYYKNVLWLQPTYKINSSLAFSAGINWGKIGIGYSYETNSSDLSALGGPSHEIILTYGFFKTHKNKIDTIIKDEEYYHNLKQKIGDKTYEEYVASNNYGFYNNIIDLTDSIHKDEVKKNIQLEKDSINNAKIAKLNKLKQDSINKARILELNKLKQDSINNVRVAELNKLKQDSLNQIKLDSLNKARLIAIEKAKRDSARAYHLRHLSKQEIEILKKGVHFELGSAMLNNESRKYLDQVAELIKNNDNIRILISGHTCDIGSDKINLKISKERAETVLYYLKQKGVNPDKISVDFKLDAEPIVPNTNEANRSKNRRVSFSIIKE